ARIRRAWQGIAASSSSWTNSGPPDKRRRTGDVASRHEGCPAHSMFVVISLMRAASGHVLGRASNRSLRGDCISLIYRVKVPPSLGAETRRRLMAKNEIRWLMVALTATPILFLACGGDDSNAGGGTGGTTGTMTGGGGSTGTGGANSGTG